MSFLYPAFLYSLLLLAIPIIIHLFNFRKYKTVYFSNLFFLRNIKKETKSKSKLKHLLILISRLLIFTFLIFAFAQPYIPNHNLINKKANLIAIYIDNSFSMDLDGKNGKLINLAKNNAIELANSYPNSTKFLLITNDFEARHQHLVSKEQFIINVTEINSTPTIKNISEIFNKFKLSNNTYSIDNYYIISDFQKFSTELNNLSIDSISDYFFVKLNSENHNNLYVDSCWFNSPEHNYLSTEEISIIIKNNSNESFQNIPIKIYINDSLKALNTVNVESNSEQLIKLSYTNTYKGLINGKIEITDYPITFDNILYFSYSIQNKIPVLVINNNKPNIYLNTLLSDSLYTFNYAKLNKINYSDFKKYNVIILDQITEFSSGLNHELKEYCKNGGNIIIFPSFEINNIINEFCNATNIPNYNSIDSLSTVIKTINNQSNIYKNVFKKIESNTNLPNINKKYLFKNNNPNSEVLLETKDKYPALIKTSFEKGNIYQFSFNTEKNSSNFSTHPLFIPTLLNIFNYSFNNSTLYYLLGNNIQFEIQNSFNDNNNLIKIKQNNTSFEFIPSFSFKGQYANIQITNELKEDGNYNIYSNQQKVTNISLNFNRKESNLESYSQSEIENIILENNYKNIKLINDSNNNIKSIINELAQGKRLWIYFILLSLLFVMSEVLLIRLLK